MPVFRTITLIKAKLPILQLKHSRSIALRPHYKSYAKIGGGGGGGGRKKGKQLRCGGVWLRYPIDNRQLFASEGATLSGIN